MRNGVGGPFGAVVVRSDALRVAGGYNARCYPSEDLDLWLRLGERGDPANLGEALLQHRRHDAAIGIPSVRR